MSQIYKFINIRHKTGVAVGVGVGGTGVGVGVRVGTNVGVGVGVISVPPMHICEVPFVLPSGSSMVKANVNTV